MKRIMGLMIVFSFLFSGTSYALILPREDSSLVMSTMKIVEDNFGRYTPIINLAKNEPVVFLTSVDQDPTWPAWMKWLEELRKIEPGKVDSLTDTELQRIWDGIFDLAIKQFDSRVNPPLGREGLNDGRLSGVTAEFAQVLIDYFLKPTDEGEIVERENIGPKTGVDEDHFIFEFVREQLHLYLDKTFGEINGLPWGVWKIVRQPRVSGSGDKYELVFREDNKTVDFVKNGQTIRVFTKPAQ